MYNFVPNEIFENSLHLPLIVERDFISSPISLEDPSIIRVSYFKNLLCKRPFLYRPPCCRTDLCRYI